VGKDHPLRISSNKVDLELAALRHQLDPGVGV
jgi:hypothetical protein